MDDSSGQPPGVPEVDNASRTAKGATYRVIFSKRFILSFTGLVVASTALFAGKISGETWVYAFLAAMGGHNAEDISRAIRNKP